MQAAEISALADRLFDSIERADAEALSEIYAPEIRVWKNYNRVAITRAEALEFLERMNRSMTGVRYLNTKRQVFDGGFVQQHNFSGTMRGNGEYVEFPVCVIALVENDRIVRIDEYLDSANRLQLPQPATA